MPGSAEWAVVAGRVDLLLAQARDARGIAARRFALDALARGLLLADPGTVDDATREAAIALRVDPSTVATSTAERQPHAVAVPLVDRAAAERSFVRQVHVVFDPVALQVDADPLEPSARRAIAAAIRGAAADAPPPSDPALHRLVAARPRALAGVRIDGPSLGAAAYASAVSLWSGRRVRPNVVVTGAVEGDAVLSVGEIPAKVRAALAHGASTLVVPAADAAVARAEAKGTALSIVAVADRRALREAVLAPSAGPRRKPEHEVAEARREFGNGWRGYRWPAIHASLSRVSGTLPAARVDLRVEILCRLAAAQRHLGDPAGSLAILEEAQQIVQSPEGRVAVPDEPIAYLLQQSAMTEKQLCRFAEARRDAHEAVEVARRARMRGVLIKALGVEGLVALAEGDPDAAIASFDESLEVTLAHDPHETARTRAYLIEAHGAAGHLDEAREQLGAAMEELDAKGENESRRASESWVRTSWGGALLALGRAEEAVAALDHPSVRVSLEDEPLPGLTARRWLGLALARAGRPEQGFEVLAASPIVHGRALEPHLSFLAHLNVLFEARARVTLDAWSSDIAGRARRALESVPTYGLDDAEVARAHRASEEALAKGDAPPAEALDVLLAQCRRLT
ncbi:MAG: S16 family serine protease [Sandaracinaceae bacterium]